MIPPAATETPGLLERVWRPHRWRLWLQFALLGIFIVAVPVFFSSRRLLDSGRNVLIEHEIIDLSDESNLRVNEFREDMAYLARDFRQLITKVGDKTPGEAVKFIQKGLELPDQPNWDEPTTIQNARRRFLFGVGLGVCAFKTGSDARQIDAYTGELPDNPNQLDAFRKCLLDGERWRTPDSKSNLSALHALPGDGKNPAPVLVVLAGKVGAYTYEFVLDFSKYIANRQRISPRHLYIVTSPNGTVLIHPQRELAGTRAAGWKFPEFQGSDWFEIDALKVEDRRKRMAGVVKSGGARLAAQPAPTLDYTYCKGYFGEAGELKNTLGGADRAKEASRELNSQMAEELNADGKLRVGEVSPDLGYIELAHPDAEKLTRIRDRIDAWWSGKTGVPRAGAKWTQPLKCSTFQGQLTPMRVDLNDEDDPAWLIVAASTEELQSDIDDRFKGVYYRWVLPTVLISCLLGTGLIVALTFSLNRLARAAAKLNSEREVALPLGGSYEVSQLARTLDALAKGVRERDRQLTDRAARYETILRAAGEGVLITNAGGVIEEANKAAIRMFGYSQNGLVGMPVSTLVLNPDLIPAASDSETMMGNPLPASRTLQTIQGKRWDGSTFWLELNLKPVPLKDRTVVVCILRDVTSRREAEERVKALNESLETRVKLRTAELEEANTKLEVALKQAEAAAKAKDTFVATMSHELRQPLHIIIGFTEALKEEAGELGASNIEPDLNKILAAAKHLLELINDILDMAKISAGKMELSLATFGLAPMVEDVKNLVGPLAEKNGNTFEVELAANLGTMVADERRVRQVLINLLSNAFKFTQSGRVSLRVDRTDSNGKEWIRFRLADTGKGMTAEQVARLFQRFYQADSSTTRGQGGTGLGLAITQSFCELMGGKPIRVTSQQGVGSEFIVELPAVVEATSPPRPKAPVLSAVPLDLGGSPKAEGRTVLVIDDDPMVRELMERFLGKEGFRVVLATNGLEGLALAKTENPCVITLDVMMPESDGWAVLGQLKDDAATRDIPVVMLTIVDDRGRGFSLGAAEYLTKPIDWQRLGATLRKYLQPGRSETVLVIDDDPQNRELVRRQLEREGWKIAEAIDGEEGLKKFAECNPGLILLDLMMPVLDGFGFLDELGKRFPGHRVPVVVFTAKELGPADFDRLNGRVTRILEKSDPANLENLVEMIRRTAKR